MDNHKSICQIIFSKRTCLNLPVLEVHGYVHLVNLLILCSLFPSLSWSAEGTTKALAAEYNGKGSGIASPLCWFLNLALSPAWKFGKFISLSFWFSILSHL